MKKVFKFYICKDCGKQDSASHLSARYIEGLCMACYLKKHGKKKSTEKCTHPCNKKNPIKPVCPLATSQKLAETIFPGGCKWVGNPENDCEWFER